MLGPGGGGNLAITSENARMSASLMPLAIAVMAAAILISTDIMYVFAKPINDFINRHPTFKILALSFLIMIGFLLTVEAFGVHVDKGYVYFAIAFACIIEVVNMRLRPKGNVVQLRNQQLK